MGVPVDTPSPAPLAMPIRVDDYEIKTFFEITYKKNIYIILKKI